MATNLKKVKEIKSKINSGLAEAYGSQNRRITANAVLAMRNPIISAIKKTLKLSQKKDKKL